MSENFERLKGTVEDITYLNEDNGYCVFTISVNDELVTVVGVLPYINIGEEVELVGEFIVHPQYGQQFKAQSAVCTMPTSTAAILKYLSSGVIKGVGPATAQLIVSKFGEKTIEVLENDYMSLAKIKGISEAKAEKIGKEFMQQFGIREVMLKLSSFNITSNEAMRIYKKLGSSSIEKIKNNPYMLCKQGIGFSFLRADEIASSLSDSIDSSFRIEAGIEFVLKHNLSNGHTCLPFDKLCETAAKLLGYEYEVCSDSLENMIYNGKLTKAVLDGRDFVFLPEYYKAERYCANRLALMMSVPPAEVPVTASRLAQVERETGVLYDEVQKQAITRALSSGMLVLTGGPGTGKTTTLNAIITLLSESGANIALAAPTGRAAKRMSELCGKEAKTLHRLLEVEWDENDKPRFKKNERNPLEYDCIVVDELSMMDITLFDALLKAMTVDCRLILVGDVDQLPSVGAGNVLNDIIESEIIPVVRLKKVFRQAQKSFIVTNAHRIIGGEMPKTSKDEDCDFFVTPSARPDELITSLVLERLPQKYGFKYEDIQVLCPSRKMKTGTVNLNNLLQSVINPENRMTKREIKRKGFILREGDKVMQVKNNYDVIWTRPNGEQGMGVYNGDIGVLESVDVQSSSVCVRFDDKLAMFVGEDIEDIELAYAITVHKSQGSEFDCVVLPVQSVPPQLKYRNLLYTAVTRAKKMLVVVGNGADLKAMIDNNKKTKRYTAFKYFLNSTANVMDDF
ncbi:MAG: ATP-dependent RecD-like DNA helicase [Clostridia bacterium]|nr:ATP-dependent RecD-like DNA helicase [Clostridia bacterium]